ncbi:glycosyl hydrolase family 65 protein [Nocardia sp. NPDC004860]|uniref:glycosyl hydrolase family 65 protein n=1 Tax=Nocardia sp. NPDC004860 TaxID=3154557 RepID=UPI0033B5F8A2
MAEVFSPNDFRAAPFLGNGRIGAMIPPSGAGYQGYGEGVVTSYPLQEPRYTGTYLAGFYADAPSLQTTQALAALPAWSGLTVAADGNTYQADVDPATVGTYSQRLNYRDATATTKATWSPSPEHHVDLEFETFISRSEPNLAIQKLTVTPHYSGQLDITDLIDGAAARRVTPVTASSDAASKQSTVGVRAENTDSTAYLVSTIDTPDNLIATSIPAAANTTGLGFTASMTAGHAYTFTKYVGIASSDDGPDPRAIATAASQRGLERGYAAEHTDHVAAWNTLWQPAIDVPGREDYRLWLRAALYSVLSSVREGQHWSVQPAGLSSTDYAGMTFWDADTFVFPMLLALYPALARTIVDFRVAALPQARANAHAYGLPGAVYPWNDGPAQRCGSPVVCGLSEEHLANDIVLAQWQYYLATADLAWLCTGGAPVITAIADYLTVRVGPKLLDGHYHYAPVGGPDEYVAVSIDNAVTNAGVVNTMRTAAAAAQLSGLPVNPRWADIAANMAMPPDIVPGVPAEYLGYQGTPIKQADTVLLSYPFSYTAPGYSAVDTYRYYFDRTDPDGPNMSNSIGAIIAAQFDPGRTQEFLDRSVQPYVREPYHFQSEARGDRSGANTIGQPAWIFVTGAAGFLQAMLYAPSGLRWTDTGPRLDPMLPSGFPDGLTIRNLSIRGSTLTLRIQPEISTVEVTAGDPITLETPTGTHTVTSAAPLTLPTRRADP